jgi:hypothetical protein
MCLDLIRESAAEVGLALESVERVRGHNKARREAP